VGPLPRLPYCPACICKEAQLFPSNDATVARTPAPSAATDAGWCLFLDVDGTLVDIAPTPDAVRVDDSLKQLLLDVRGTLAGAVALVSGRTLSTLDELFAPQR